MAVDFNTALSAYSTATKRPALEAGATLPAFSETVIPSGKNFADLVKNALDKTVDLNKQAENLSMKAIAGEADMNDVVLAVSNAEAALDHVIAVRDKVVTAYKEIMSMPI